MPVSHHLQANEPQVLEIPLKPRPCPRRNFLGSLALSPWLLTASIGGCTGNFGPRSEPDLVWGRRGLSAGRFLKPRALAIDRHDCLYIVDTTGRIQVFDADGKLLRGWSTPETLLGRPTGMYVDAQDRLLVADTHYHRLLFYTLDGKWLEDQTIGGDPGTVPGKFAFVTDVVRDSSGKFYIGDYGDADRVQRFSQDRNFECQWGGTGDAPGQLVRPQSLAMDSRDRLWVADACNHRIQVFDTGETPPKLIQMFGKQGSGIGELQYPYGITFDREDTLWVCEYGNQRLQRFDLTGKSLTTWGGPGRLPGQLNQPWGVVCDSQNRLHVLDSNNHRVQRLVI